MFASPQLASKLIQLQVLCDVPTTPVLQVFFDVNIDIFVLGNRLFLEAGSEVPTWVSLAKSDSDVYSA
ncbi:uncharacterized protein RCO7_15039 [Rhynchosporium graminicola]|uniref:Uncharacterized protein n=2 Tax=Rhynchosporium TaxID=38037 RepID=A0A1E1M614_RHYSE|nr:uncharacterized protein RCO7_15039 [Rhynchosporium commune]CZT44549.1 uncharacterized protein RSE6_04734 [Rhynchosporium secalis]